MKLLLAEGLSAQDVSVLELPEQYLLGAEPGVYAVYTLNGGTKQESASVRVKAEITGLAELLEQSTGTTLEAARDVEPGSGAWLLAGISVGLRRGCGGGHGVGAAAACTPEKAPQNGKAPQQSVKACFKPDFSR